MNRTVTVAAGIAAVLGLTLFGGPATAHAGVDLPDGAEVVERRGVDVVIVPQELSTEELAALGESQTDAEIEATIELASEEASGQVLIDTSNPGAYSAAVLVDEE